MQRFLAAPQGRRRRRQCRFVFYEPHLVFNVVSPGTGGTNRQTLGWSMGLVAETVSQ